MFAQAVGRKHSSLIRCIQEDAIGWLWFRPSWPQAATVYGAYVCDGHGVAHSALPGPSPSEVFQQLLVAALPKTLKTLFDEAFDERIKDNNAEPLAWFIAKKLELLNERLDSILKDTDEYLCKENGSTLALVLIHDAHLFCCNIGDSQILLFDRADASGTPLKVWKLDSLVDSAVETKPINSTTATTSSSSSLAAGGNSNSKSIKDESRLATPSSKTDTVSATSDTGSPGEDFNSSDNVAQSSPATAKTSIPNPSDPDAHICSFPDSLFLQEGTCQRYITKQYAYLRQRASLAGGGGPTGGYIHSPRSKYRLGMTRTIGNNSHKQNLMVGCSVYMFNVEELADCTAKGRILVVLTSDGIKDLMKAHHIGLTFQSIPAAIQTLTSPTKPISLAISSSPRLRTAALTSAISNLITRTTPDAHDRAAKSHLIQLVESVSDTHAASPTPTDADTDSNSAENFAHDTWTDCRIAAEAVVDLAILRGSTDDVSVVAFEIGVLRAGNSDFGKNDCQLLDAIMECEENREAEDVGFDPVGKRFVWDCQKTRWYVERVGAKYEIPMREVVGSGVLSKPVLKDIMEAIEIRRRAAAAALGIINTDVANETAGGEVKKMELPAAVAQIQEESLISATSYTKISFGQAVSGAGGFGEACAIAGVVDVAAEAGFSFGGAAVHETSKIKENFAADETAVLDFGASNMELNNISVSTGTGEEDSVGDDETLSIRKRKL